MQKLEDFQCEMNKNVINLYYHHTIKQIKIKLKY